MSLGAGAYKVGENGQCSSTRRYPWQPCERPLQGTVTLNYSVEYLPTNTYLTLRQREGGLGKTQHKNGKQATRLYQRGASAKGIPLPPTPPHIKHTLL